MYDIPVTLTTNPKKKPEDESKLGFGKIFTDHMFIMDYDDGQGWHDARIVPFGPISMHPGSTILHYGAGAFEGLKAYRKADGTCQLFRPSENAKRMEKSVDRLCLPHIDAATVLEAIETFVTFEQDWVPSDPGTSLYIRPFEFGCDEPNGLHGIKKAKFMIITCPVGNYYKEGLKPVKITIEEHDVRAIRGGTGDCKVGGNYAASNRAEHVAEENGFTQVLWLDGVHQKYTLLQEKETNLYNKYVRVLQDGFLWMDQAENILVIKTISGMAMAIAAAIDNLEVPGVVGTIAGDDTVMCAVHSVGEVPVVMTKIDRLLKEEK